jgi:hypothetical protein
MEAVVTRYLFGSAKVRAKNTHKSYLFMLTFCGKTNFWKTPLINDISTLLIKTKKLPVQGQPIVPVLSNIKGVNPYGSRWPAFFNKPSENGFPLCSLSDGQLVFTF